MSMRRFISALDHQPTPIRSNFLTDLQALTEGAAERYLQMFQGMPDIEAAKAEVKWARDTLKREDRIIWYLRWARLRMMARLVAQASEPNAAKLKASYAKMVQEMGKRTQLHADQISSAANQTDSYRWRNYMAHAVSMFDVIPQMDAYQFNAQTPDTIEADLVKIEKDYAPTSGKHIEPTEERHAKAEKIIDFGDGFSWWNLNQAACGEEGNAMGHCGNTATPRRGQKLLSLRQRVMKGGKSYDLPCLTFILDRNGMLGEMKGRANEKPNEKYHKYIVPLLMSDFVEGIRGGGYLRQNNFSIDDLPENVRAKLIAKKPALENSMSLEDAVSTIRDYYSDYDVTKHLDVAKDAQGNDCVIVWQGDLDDLEGGQYLDALRSLVETVSDVGADYTKQDLYDMLQHLGGNALRAIAKMTGYQAPPAGHDPHYISGLYRAVERSGKVREFIEQALTGKQPLDPDALREFIKNYIYIFAPVKQNESVDPLLNVPSDPFKGTYTITITATEAEMMSEIIEQINDHDDGDDEDGDGDEFEGPHNELRYVVNEFSDGWFATDYNRDESAREKINDKSGDAFDVNPIDRKIAQMIKEIVKGSGKKTKASATIEIGGASMADAVERALAMPSRANRPGPDDMKDLF